MTASCALCAAPDGSRRLPTSVVDACVGPTWAGFAELDDETIADHLAVVFTPDDGVGNDGKVHEELSGCACACGFSGSSGEDLERHLMALFIPGDGFGLDGQRHGARDVG